MGHKLYCLISLLGVFVSPADDLERPKLCRFVFAMQALVLEEKARRVLEEEAFAFPSAVPKSSRDSAALLILSPSIATLLCPSGLVSPLPFYGEIPLRFTVKFS